MLLETHPCTLIGCYALPHAVCMCVFLCCEDFGDAHVCQLPIEKWIIPCNFNFLTCIHMVEQYLYWLFGVIRCLHFVLIPHQVSRHYLEVPKVEPSHQFDK